MICWVYGFTCAVLGNVFQNDANHLCTLLGHEMYRNIRFCTKRYYYYIFYSDFLIHQNNSFFCCIRW